MMTGTRELKNEEIQSLAPSVFADKPYEDRSNRYKFIPTIEVLNGLRREGLVPVKAAQSRCRLLGKAHYTKHMLRLRLRENLEVKEKEEVPEIVLINSHDGTAAYQIMLGFFRLVCANGLIVGDTISRIRTVHAGDKNLKRDIIRASFELVENTPKVVERINSWKQLVVPREQQLTYAQSALTLSPSTLDIAPEDILSHRRLSDRGNEKGERNLWTTYNVVQENFIKGKVRGFGKNGKRRKTRKIKSIHADVKLNKALWILTEEMAKIIR